MSGCRARNQGCRSRRTVTHRRLCPETSLLARRWGGGFSRRASGCRRSPAHPRLPWLLRHPRSTGTRFDLATRPGQDMRPRRTTAHPAAGYPTGRERAIATIGSMTGAPVRPRILTVNRLEVGVGVARYLQSALPRLACGGRSHAAPIGLCTKRREQSLGTAGPAWLCRWSYSEVLGPLSQEGGLKSLHPIVECELPEQYNLTEEML